MQRIGRARKVERKQSGSLTANNLWMSQKNTLDVGDTHLVKAKIAGPRFP
jgi:hypothetical protein